MSMLVAYFHNEILRRSGVAAFPTPYNGLEYSITDNHTLVGNPPPYVPQPSSIDVDLLMSIKKPIKESISTQYEYDRVRWAANEFYDIFQGVAAERRETLAKIRAHEVYRNLPQTKKEEIINDVLAFFARRYTSFVAIVTAPDTITAGAAPPSLRIPHNEEIISNLDRHKLLILPDNPDEDEFDFIAPLLRADPSLRAEDLRRAEGGDPNQDVAKGQLSGLNQKRWEELLKERINRVQ